jgi:hypothetical protein
LEIDIFCLEIKTLLFELKIKKISQESEILTEQENAGAFHSPPTATLLFKANVTACLCFSSAMCWQLTEPR